MASEIRKYAVPLQQKCPFCLETVSSVKRLPCAHHMCDKCFEKLIEARTLICPECTNPFKDADNLVRTFFALIECGNCLKLKEAEEFYWCVECVKVLCCRCLTKQKHFSQKHRLIEWNTPEAISSCVQSVYRLSPGKANLKQSLHRIMKPVMESVLAKTEKKLSSQRDSMERLHSSFGLLTPPGNSFCCEIDNSESFNLLQTLMGFDIRGTEETDQKSAIVGLQDPDTIAEIIFQQLQFGTASENSNHDSENDTQSDKADMVKLNANSKDESLNPLPAKDSLTITNISDSQNIVSENHHGEISISIPGRDTSSLTIRTGSVSSFAYYDDKKASVCWKEQSDLQPIDMSLVSPESRFMDIAIFDTLPRAYVLENRCAENSVWFHVYEFQSKVQKSIIVQKIPNMSEVQVTGLVCCTDTGIPFAVINHKFNVNATAASNSIDYTLIYTFSGSPTISKANTAHKLEGTIAHDIEVLKPPTFRKRIFLIVVCDSTVEILVRSNTLSILKFQSIPQFGLETFLLPISGKQSEKIALVKEHDGFYLRVFSLDDKKELFVPRLAVHNLTCTTLDKIINQNGRLYQLSNVEEEIEFLPYKIPLIDIDPNNQSEKIILIN